MKAATKHKSWPNRILRMLLSLIIVFILCAILLRIFITTAPGARFIENQVNKRSFGPIETIEMSGFSGDPLKDISIERLVIKDKNGVWLRIENIEMKWKPLAYFKDHLWIKNLAIGKTDILRRPALNPTESTKPLPKMTLETFKFGVINLNENLIGQFLSLESSGQFIAETSGAITAKVSAARLDALGDVLELDFKRTDAGAMTGVFSIEGAAGGPIANLFKAFETVTGSGKISGTDITGAGNVAVALGNKETLIAKVDWTGSAITGNANINLDGWPAFEVIRETLGSNVTSTLKIDRNDTKTFNAALNVPGLSVNAVGNLPKEGFVPAQANVDIKADKVSTFVTMPDGYWAGSATAKGRLALTVPYGFDGRISLANLKSPYGNVKQINGPLSALQNGTGKYNFKTDFTLENTVTTAALPIDLAVKTGLKAAGSFDLGKGRIVLKSFGLASGINQVTGKGTLTTDAQNIIITANGTAAIKAQGSIPEGILKADVALRKTPFSLLAVTTDGTFRPRAPMAEPFRGLIGEQLVFKAAISPVHQGLKISNASIVGDNAKAAIDGTFGERLNLSGEAILSAPLMVTSVTIDGGAEASFTVTGSRRATAIRLDAKAGSVTAQNYTMKNARLRTEVTDIFEAPKGPVQIEAETEHGPFSASAQFASTPGVYIANDIDLAWGRLMAEGDLELPEDGIAIGKINLNLPEREGQYARAALTLTNASGEQGIGLTADAKQIAFKGFDLDTLTAKANGTLALLAGTVAAKGQRGENVSSRGFDLDTPFMLTRSADEGFSVKLSPKVNYGNIAVTARSPIVATYNAGEISLNAPLAVLDGTVDVIYQRGEAREIFKLDANSLPISLIPMPGNLADTRGRISADVDFSSQNRTALTGTGEVTLTDWRGFDVKKDEGLTGILRTVIDGGVAETVLTASSPAGFKADGKLRTPLANANSMAGTRLNMSAPISGEYTASGAAAAVFGLFTPSDAELGGSLSANIEIAGTAKAPRVEGKAGGRDIRFEMPELGTRVRKGRVTAKFTNDSLSVSDLYVADADDGTLMGAGEFKLGELGRPIGNVDIKANNFRVLDRKDVDAKVDGKLAFESSPKDATLSGDITIKNAEIKQFVTGSVSVIEIDVDEINRPNQEDKITIQEPKTPINLDLRIRAPRKIYVRSRGMDVEMAVDATIQGTVTEPLFFGEAKVVRGGYKIAGKTLEFVDGTITFDGGLANTRVDFKAVTETQNLDASVTIKGTVKDPEIALSSTPERPQDEILSALLFGRSATELSTIEAAQLAGALAQFSGAGGGFDFLGGLRDAFGIGQLSVNFNPEGSAQLVGGRYLAKNVYLEVFSGAGPDQTGAIIDWELRKNIALRSRIRADNDQALSLKWKRDF